MYSKRWVYWSKSVHTCDSFVRAYETQQDVAVFNSSWIHAVTKNSCTIHDVPLGQHLVLPHHLFPGETGSPRATLRCVANHACLTNTGNEWGNSRAWKNHGNEAKACVDKKARTNVDRNGGVHPQMSESASVMFAEYNATWDELESRLNSTDLKGMFTYDQWGWGYFSLVSLQSNCHLNDMYLRVSVPSLLLIYVQKQHCHVACPVYKINRAVHIRAFPCLGFSCVGWKVMGMLCKQHYCSRTD